MAIFLFSGKFFCGEVTDEGTVRLCLFEEDEKTFSKWFRDKLTDGTLTDDDVEGLTPEELGTHSYRKGATTHSDAFPGGPSGTAVNLRAGWREEKSRERYTFPTEGQDQFLGRVLALLPISDMQAFCILPPHFHSFDLRYVELMTNDVWEEIIPSYS